MHHGLKVIRVGPADVGRDQRVTQQALDSLSDLAKVAVALDKGSFLRKESMQAMWTPAQLGNGALNGFGIGWVGETAARPQTSTPTIDALTFPAMELYAMPAATQTLLDDAIVDIEQWIASEVFVAFAEQEGTAFVTGNGVNKPTGFLSYPKSTTAADRKSTRLNSSHRT